MSNKKQRERIREARVAFDRAVEESRKIADLRSEKAEPTNESTTKKKRGRPPKKALEGDSK
jgi:hypothetical protein